MKINKILSDGIEAISQTAKKITTNSKAIAQPIQNGDRQLALTLNALATQNLVGKKIGILSKKGIMNSCFAVGDVLSETAKVKNGKLDIEDINNAVRKVFPDLKGITISQDYEVYRKFMQELGYSDSMIKMFANSTLGLAISNPKTKQTLLRIGNIQGLRADKTINLSTHELEHALYKTYSLSSKTGAIEAKIFPKSTDKIMAKAPLINEKIAKMQQHLMRLSGFGGNAIEGTFDDIVADRSGLIKVLKMSSFEDLQAKIRDIIRATVVLPDNNKDNIMILKATRQLFQDEARAYKVGGINARKHLNFEKGCTKSEMYSKFYEEVVSVLDEEIELQKKNRLKKLAGLKPIDYHVDISEVSPFTTLFRATSKDAKVISVDELLKELES